VPRGSEVDGVEFAYAGLNLAGLATANRVGLASAATTIALAPIDSSNRTTSSAASSAFHLAGSGRQVRETSSLAQSAFSLAYAGSAARDVHSSGSAAFALGQSGSGPKDAHPSASTSFVVVGLASQARDVHTIGVTEIGLAPAIGAVRVMTRPAVTSLVLKGVAEPVNFALGGSTVASANANYTGSFAQGQVVTLQVRTYAYQGRPALPDSAPTATIIAPDNSVVMPATSMPITDKSNSPYLFSLPINLGVSWGLGRYRVVYQWSVGGYRGSSLDNFDVSTGGDATGSIVSLFSYDRPEARYVIAQTSGGQLIQGRNPGI
jgi:hypothetical protein